MGRTLRGLLVVLIVLGSTGCSDSSVKVESESPREPVVAQASVDRAVATTGDLITYRIVVDAESDFQIEVPEAGAEIAGFRIVDIGRTEPESRNGRTRRERWYELRADLVGSYVLPPIEVRYRRTVDEGQEPGPWQTVTTSEIFVEVESVLPTEGGAEDIRGLKPLRKVRSPVPWLQIAVGLVLILLVAAGVWWYLRRRARRRDEVPVIPPHELAFESLNALRETDFDDPLAVRRFYFQISEVIRVYVEGRFGMNATDLTTEEILSNLAHLQELDGEQHEVLEGFLLDSDQVKFAHRDPSQGEIETIYERALGFVEATQPVAEVSAEETTLQEAA